MTRLSRIARCRWVALPQLAAGLGAAVIGLREIRFLQPLELAAARRAIRSPGAVTPARDLT